ncbi:MAG: VanW, partial [Parcubacteria group bacterium LiPW_39]
MVNKIGSKTVKFFILPVICLLLAVFAWQLINRERTLPSLTVAGLPIGWMKTDLAKTVLVNQLKKFNNEKITFVYESKTWQFTPGEFGLRINLKPTLAQINSLGHEANLLAAAAEWFGTLFSEKKLPLNYSFDLPKLKEALAVLAAAEKPARNATLKYNPRADDFEILAAQKGTLINRGQLVADIINTFAKPGQTVALTLSATDPSLKEENLAEAKESAKNLLEQTPYFLQSPDTAWRIEK